MNQRDHILSKIAHVPPLSKSVNRLISLLEDPDSTVQEMALVLDPSLCTTILSMSNSAFYSTLRQIRDIEHAIAILGRNAIRDIVLGIAITQMFEEQESGENSSFSGREFWRKTIISALLAKMFGRLLGNPDTAKLYTLGLIHDIGEISLYHFFPKEFRDIEKLKEEKIPPLEAEIKILGMDHSELGGLLSKKWNLPEDMSRIITHHHRPKKLKNNLDELRMGLILYSSDLLTDELLGHIGWSRLAADDEQLERSFANLCHSALSLVEKMTDKPTHSTRTDSWTERIEEELVQVSRSIEPVMASLILGGE